MASPKVDARPCTACCPAAHPDWWWSISTTVTGLPARRSRACSMADGLAALVVWLRGLDSSAIAVSGGVDSMTLAVIAHRTRDAATTMFHAVSPAVPPEATERVRRYARSEGWDLQVFDAGEFGDTNYLSNPVNRCFHCKTHLYGAIADRTSATLLSGTNIDDLGDFRPGLAAARTFDVRHPLVEV